MSMSRSPWRTTVAGLSGMVFGAGLAAAQMIDPNKVLNFLDVGGTWDASLILVLGAATGFFAIAHQLAGKSRPPLLDDQFDLPPVQRVDSRLLAGSVLFGIGWGIAGYCPGPAIASVGVGNPEALWFLPAMLAGIALQRWLAGGRTAQGQATV